MKRKPSERSSVDRSSVRPPSMRAGDFNKRSKSLRKGGKFQEIRQKHEFTPPPDSITYFQFVTDGDDDGYYRGVVHEAFSGSPNFRQFFCLKDSTGIGKCTGCKKKAEQRPFSACLIYVIKVVDSDDNEITEWKYGKKQEVRKLKGLKYWTHSPTVAKKISAKMKVSGLPGVIWALARDGADMKTTYDLEAHKDKALSSKVKEMSTKFFQTYLDGMTRTDTEVAEILKNFSPPSDDDLMPEDDEGEEGHGFGEMSRKELKRYIRKHDKDFTFKRKHTDDDLREYAQELALGGESDTDDDFDEDDR